MTINQSYDILYEPQVDIAPNLSTRLAHGLSIVFSPPLVMTGAAAMIAAVVGTFNAWLWAGEYVLIAVVVPALFVLWLVKRGAVSDFDLQYREQRTLPYVATLAYISTALALQLHQHAPALFIALGYASLLEMGLLFLVTLRWKISAHTAGAAALAVLAWQLALPIALPLTLAVPLLAWARLRLRRHTLMQTLAGAFAGAVVFGFILYVTA
jgi:membrane-associated phospholipid phosphatase